MRTQPMESMKRGSKKTIGFESFNRAHHNSVCGGGSPGGQCIVIGSFLDGYRVNMSCNQDVSELLGRLKASLQRHLGYIRLAGAKKR